MERMKLDVMVMALKAALGLLILFAVLAVGVVPAFAERGCLGDPASTGRTCPVEECVALQNDVNSICKNPPPLPCRKAEGCNQLRREKNHWIDCAAARARINMRCWSGGDLGHQHELEKAWNHVSECETLIALPQPTGCADPCPQDSGSSLQAPVTSAGATEDDIVDFLIPALERLAAEGLLELFFENEAEGGLGPGGIDDTATARGLEGIDDVP